MEEIKFTHTYNQELYDKAKIKFDKMLDTDSGKKFFVHLVKAFVQSGTNHEVEHTDDPSGLLICDLTKAKLATTELFNQFKTNYKIKVENFLRYENESDENFEKRRDSFIMAYRTSSPYACDAAMAITADKTDKVLCVEAIQALTDKFNEVAKDPKYEDIMKIINFIPKSRMSRNQHKDKNTDHKKKKKTGIVYSTKADKSTLSDDPALNKLKAHFDEK